MAGIFSINPIESVKRHLGLLPVQSVVDYSFFDVRPPKGDMASRLCFSVVTGDSSPLVDEVQALRYRVFYEEMHAKGKRINRRLRRDRDHHDAYCDHLIARDEVNGCTVGAIRLLRREAARRAGGFLTAKEFNIKRLLSVEGEVLEVGRFLVHPAYRKSIAIILLWRALVEYVSHHHIEFLFGCASFSGTDPKQWSHQLTWLWRHRMAPREIRPRARRRLRISMNKHKKIMSSPHDMPPLPPLLKAYMHAGAFVGDGAVVDKKFNTTDVCVLVKSGIAVERYLSSGRTLLDFERKESGAA